jgi:hypothetical protein
MTASADHSYLFKPGRWRLAGVFVDADGLESPLTGEVLVRHGDQTWEVVSTFSGFENRVEAVPFAPGAPATAWRSVDRAIGPLQGQFTLMANAIVSSFQSRDGRYHGTDVFIRLSTKRYRSRGLLFERGRRLSSWNATLDWAED